MKQLEIPFPAILPESDFSCEQKYITIRDIEDGKLENLKPHQESGDFTDDDEDDFDSMCRQTFDLDQSFEHDIQEQKQFVVPDSDPNDDNLKEE